MPPESTWYTGRRAVSRFFGTRVFGGPGRIRMVPTAANGQPGMTAYMLGDDGRYHVHALQVLTVTPAGVARIVVFRGQDIFPLFALPPTLD
jgi:RNA polymerase sigma-70 factor (ECF subfamily)